MKIPFSPPYIDEDVRKEVYSVLNSGWITSGPKVLELEKELARIAGIQFAACCNSATSGLLLALYWFGIGKGDEVIVPAYTYAATALVVMHLGAKPVLVDCGPDLNIDVRKIGQVITEKTKAVIPVDVAGLPCNYDVLYEVLESEVIRKKFRPANEIQRRMGRPLILVDAAHSVGAAYKQTPSGSIGDLSVFSFHAVKNITTAEGGAICINLPKTQFIHEEVYRTFKLWSLNGQTKDALAKTNGAGWKYDIVYPGFKMNMPDICAAIGLAQLRKYQSHILPERWRVCRTYIRLLSKHSWVELPVLEDDKRKSSCHVFAMRIKNISEAQRDRIIEEITTQGVSVNVHFQPLPLLSVFKERGYHIDAFPVAYDHYSREISLPVYPQLSDEHVHHVVQAVENAYNKIVLL